MEIVLLDEVRFDNFAANNKYATFYQTSAYGNLMSKNGHNSYYLGLVDEFNNIKAATLIIVKNNKEKKKMGYAPRGFLIDWEDEELVKTFTLLLKDFFAKRGFSYIKLDPPVILKEHNVDGSDKLLASNNSSFVKRMQSLGYIHMGYNNGLESNKPRWNALTELDSNIIPLYNSISMEAKQKIMIAHNHNIKVYRGSKEDINSLYELIDYKKPPIDYYLDYYEFFNKINGFELYFAKLETISFVSSSKQNYEEEEQKNNKLNKMIQDINVVDKSNIINQKIESDEKLAKYKKDMLDAINLFQSHPNGIILSGVAIIKYNKIITFLTSAINNDYDSYFPEYLLKWQLIEEFARKGYKIIDNNGILGDLAKDYDTTIKRELSNKIIEYVGEFDLVINKKAYYTGKNPILNWLNTPI